LLVKEHRANSTSAHRACRICVASLHQQQRNEIMKISHRGVKKFLKLFAPRGFEKILLIRPTFAQRHPQREK
ncbi:hypothetical protein KQH60_05195, partial [Mycetohabitans sp. B8]|uniref:hypothetical protein n=1 Tax=Mycetohabitans sp. B8 TaxID=2841845 RepID=UPI001F452D42